MAQKDAIERTRLEWRRRAASALEILEPIEKTKLPIVCRETTGAFKGSMAESPECYKSFQQAIKGTRLLLKTLDRIL